MGYLKSHDVVFQPIERWPGKETPSYVQKRSPFDAPWTATLDLLDRELHQLRAKLVVIQAFVKPGQLRLDGGLRSGTNPSRPGIILSFDSKNGPMMFPCDTFDKWGDNLRAIALALEALRKIDRYGVTSRAEQYTGFKALPQPETIETRIPTREAALAFIFKVVTCTTMEIDAMRRGNAAIIADVIRRAQFITHPDRKGDPDDFKRVMRCEQLLKGPV